MKEVIVTTQKSARVYFSTAITSKTKEVIIACHGYAQLGKYFIKKFEALSSESVCVVIPEGLSKFYWEGMGGKVVASWMTKEDRENEIRDYVSYLTQVYELILDQNPKVSITAFGFSQGTSTISRWLALADSLTINRLILWSGSFPMDVVNHEVFSKIKVDYVVGNKDEYLSNENIEKLMLELTSRNIKPKLTTFDGGHEIKETVLLKLFY